MHVEKAKQRTAGSLPPHVQLQCWLLLLLGSQQVIMGPSWACHPQHPFSEPAATARCLSVFRTIRSQALTTLLYPTPFASATFIFMCPTSCPWVNCRTDVSCHNRIMRVSRFTWSSASMPSSNTNVTCKHPPPRSRLCTGWFRGCLPQRYRQRRWIPRRP